MSPNPRRVQDGNAGQSIVLHLGLETQIAVSASLDASLRVDWWWVHSECINALCIMHIIVQFLRSLQSKKWWSFSISTYVVKFDTSSIEKITAAIKKNIWNNTLVLNKIVQTCIIRQCEYIYCTYLAICYKVSFNCTIIVRQYYVSKKNS